MSLKEIIDAIERKDADWLCRHMWLIQKNKEWLQFVKERTMSLILPE